MMLRIFALTNKRIQKKDEIKAANEKPSEKKYLLTHKERQRPIKCVYAPNAIAHQRAIVYVCGTVFLFCSLLFLLRIKKVDSSDQRQ